MPVVLTFSCVRMYDHSVLSAMVGSGQLMGHDVFLDMCNNSSCYV